MIESTVQETKAQPTTEPEARASDIVLRTDAETASQPQAESKARVEWEQATSATAERLAHAGPPSSAAPVSTAAPEPVSAAAPEPDAVVTAEPVREPAEPVNFGPVQVTKARAAEAPRPHEKAEPAITVWAAGKATPVEARSEFLKGEARFAKGDLEAARQHFRRAVELGMAEGALALGNTYDQVSLTKAGLKLTGDPERARQWYRRAYELAQRQK